MYYKGLLCYNELRETGGGVMQTKHFKYIQEIAQWGSITKAAEKLWISQQALSRILDHMEQELGFRIFERTNKGVRVTKKGETFLLDIERMLAIMATWEQQREEKYKVQILLQYVLSDLILDETFYHAVNDEDNLELEWEVLHPPEIVHRITTGERSWGIFVASPQSEIYPKLKRAATSPKMSLAVISSAEHAQMHVLLHRDDPLAKKEKLTLSDLQDREFAINKGILMTETPKKLSSSTTVGTKILPQTVHPVDYVIRNERAFTCLPGFIAKNNVHVRKGIVVVKQLEEILDEGLCCYLLYRTDQVVDMQEVVNRLQAIF